MKLIGNFKMNLTYPEVCKYLQTIQASENMIFCPTNLYLPFFLEKGLTVGIQDVSEYSMGSYTGQTSASQASSLGVKYAIIGHSERRKKYKDENLKEKINQAIYNNLKVIYCIGEEEGQNKQEILIHQLSLLEGVIHSISIVYEPVWAIDTGKVPTNQEIEETVLFIKEYCQKKFHLSLEVYYGGSVDEENIKKLKTISSLDGFLVGKASYDSEKFNQMSNILFLQ